MNVFPMPPVSFRIGLILPILWLAACTQKPSEIELKGQSTFSRSAGNGYASNNAGGGVYNRGASSYQPAPVYTNMAAVQNAPTSSIGVSDLAAPTAAPKAQAKVEAAAPASQSNWSAKPQKPQTDSTISVTDTAPPAKGADAPVNAWTQKPRFSDATGIADDEDPVREEAKAAVHDVQAKTAAAKDDVKDIKDSIKEDVKSASKPTDSGFMWPVSSHKVISGFGPKGGGKVNDGINIASSEGEPVWAAADGEIVYAGNELKGYGNMVLIKHAGGKTTAYAHMSRITAEKYARVKQGDIIGYVGATGNVKEPQLHFAIRDGKTAIDPQKLLSSKLAGA